MVWQTANGGEEKGTTDSGHILGKWEALPLSV